MRVSGTHSTVPDGWRREAEVLVSPCRVDPGPRHPPPGCVPRRTCRDPPPAKVPSPPSRGAREEKRSSDGARAGDVRRQAVRMSGPAGGMPVHPAREPGEYSREARDEVAQIVRRAATSLAQRVRGTARRPTARGAPPAPAWDRAATGSRRRDRGAARSRRTSRRRTRARGRPRPRRCGSARGAGRETRREKRGDRTTRSSPSTPSPPAGSSGRGAARRDRAGRRRGSRAA